MSVVDLATLTSSLSPEAPCGPDLDAEGDIDFMNYMARAEGLLPASYFSGPEGLPFDRSSIDLSKEFSAAAPFLKRTRDIRLLVLLAKFAVLNRSTEDFITCLRGIVNMLETQWDNVHPRAEGGEFVARMAALETLDDTAPVVMPLQYLPLVQSRRSGPIAYRHVMFANGEAQPREGEEVHDKGTIDKALGDAEIETLVAQRDAISAIRSAFGAIEKACGTEVKLAKVTALTTNIFRLLNNAVALRDPSSAVAGEAAAMSAAGAQFASAPVGRLRSRSEAVAALAAVEQYFCRLEPSNPALLLVRQAQQLIGKSFLEAMQILVPGRVAEAKFRLGKDQTVEIPVEALASFSTVDGASYDTADTSDAVAASGESEGQAADTHHGSAPVPPSAGTRIEAFALLEQVALYYRAAEPSSPIASLADRARGFADRDFLTLLKDLLPISSSD
jgi:type VI secretion system protein ImpA